MDSSSNQVPLLTPRHITRDEMNLSEFPLTVLSTRNNPSLKTLEFTDTIRDKAGKPIQRKWVITGADKFGLPTSSDDEVILGLLKLTVNGGFKERKVFFTRYELLRILRWTTEGRSYQRLQNALDRLSGVRIKASNAFFDNELKAHSTKNFGIVDAYELNDGREDPKPSFFIWSEVLFKSFQDGFIKKLDLDFYLTLESAVSKRLYRYLDKHFWYRSRIQMNLFALAHEKVGVSRKYRFASSIRQQIDPALEELMKRGCISHFDYEGKGKDTVISIYSASAKPRSLQKGTPSSAKEVARESYAIVPAAESRTGREFFDSLVSKLVSRGLREQQAASVLRDQDEVTLRKIEKIVMYFDRLIGESSHLISRSPVGFLYKAVKEPNKFVLPGETPGRDLVAREGSTQATLNLEITRSNVISKKEEGQSGYLVYRAKKIRELKEEVEPKILSRLREEVTTALHKIRGIITDARFEEVVEHGVEDKVASLFKIPSFDEWRKTFKSSLQ